MTLPDWHERAKELINTKLKSDSYYSAVQESQSLSLEKINLIPKYIALCELQAKMIENLKDAFWCEYPVFKDRLSPCKSCGQCRAKAEQARLEEEMGKI